MKRCAICGESVEKGSLTCSSCGSGVFESQKTHPKADNDTSVAGDQSNLVSGDGGSTPSDLGSQHLKENQYGIVVAASKGDDRSIKESLRLGANVNCQQETSGDAPLHFATRWNHKKVVKILLAHGAFVNSRNGTGQTPLHVAATFGRKEIAGILLKHGADLNAKNTDGETPLQIAERGDSVGLVKLMHKHVKRITSDSASLPTISQECLHGNFGDLDVSLPEDTNAPRVSDGATHFNNGDYEEAFSTVVAALKANPNEYEKSVAHDVLGIIEIKRGNLFSAIDNFLCCLRLRNRDRFHTWQSAKYLHYIYSEAKQRDTANALQRLSELASREFKSHSKETEREVRNLTKSTLKMIRKGEPKRPA